MKELFEGGIFKQDIPLLDIKGEPITISQEVNTGKTILVTSSWIRTIITILFGLCIMSAT